MMEKGVRIFIAYAHEDEHFRKELEKHLSQLKWLNLIDVWHDRNIGAGTDWEQVISTNLNTAQIILLLISPDFLASKYCYSIETRRALERHQMQEAHVIPIILRPVDWEGAPFSQLQALPTDATPIMSSKWHNQDEAFVDVVKGLRKIIKDFKPRKIEQEQVQMSRVVSLSTTQEISYIGKQIGGYSILMELGSGTYGQVYWGKQNIQPERFVAIKIMHAIHLGSKEKKSRFLQETQLLRILKYSYILQVIDSGFHEGLPYIVTEFAANGSLRDLLKRHSPSPLSVEQVLTILSQVGQALDYSHHHDVIHRDLKPENILFDTNNKALLADFGTATILTTAGNERIEIAGTAQYMAPEQFAGNASKKSDQYALGCIAYELLTGHTPFDAKSFVSAWFQHSYKAPASLMQYAPQLPPHIDRAVLKSLAKEPEKRHSDVSAFIAALYDEKGHLQDHEYLQNEKITLFGGYIRRLPLYLLIDCSRSMAGDPILAVNEGLHMIYNLLMADPQALETVWVNVIYFSDYVDQTGLIPLDMFVPPLLVIGGSKRAMGAAFHVLVESIEQDLKQNTPKQLGDFRPLVFLLTDGSPTDHYRYELQRLHSLRGGRKPTIIALGCGNEVNTAMLHELTSNVFLMHSVSPEAIKAFFKWISGSIAQTSLALGSNNPDQTTMMTPPTIPGIMYSPDYDKE